MAAETIKEFLVGLGFKVDQAGLSKFSAGIAGAAAKAAALGAAVTAAAGVIAMGIKKIAEEGELEARLAERFRATAAAVDGFIDSATILGVKSDDAIESLRSLDRAVVDTSMGMGRAKKVFEELGIEVKDAAGNLRPTTEVMGELAGKMKELDRGTQLRIMERLGLDQKLLYVFNADLEKLGKEIAEIDKGAGFSFDKWIAESKTFMAAWREMSREAEKWKMLFGKWIKGMAVELMPVFRTQLGRMTAGMLELRKKAMEHLPKIAQSFLPVLRGIFKIAEAFIKIGMRVGQAVIGIVSFIARINDATDGWLLKIAAVVAAWKYLNLSFLASPIGIILSLAAAIALVVDDFLTWKEGGESLIDWSGDFGAAMQASIDFVLALGDAIVQGIGVAREWLAGFFDWCAQQWAQMRADWQATVAALAAAGQALINAWQSVKAFFAGLFDLLSSGFARVAQMAANLGGTVGGIIGKVRGLVPGAATRATLAGGQSVQQSTTINVSGAGNPGAVAARVAGQQRSVNAEMTRNMRGATR